MKKISLLVAGSFVALVMGMFSVLALNSPAVAACSGVNCVTEGVNATNTGGSSTSSLPAVLKKIVNVLLFIIGAVSVIMIVIGGLKYVTSNGDSSQVTSAKNTIMYAVIGVIVALLAYAIVNFVVAQFVK